MEPTQKEVIRLGGSVHAAETRSSDQHPEPEPAESSPHEEELSADVPSWTLYTPNAGLSLRSAQALLWFTAADVFTPQTR